MALISTDTEPNYFDICASGSTTCPAHPNFNWLDIKLLNAKQPETDQDRKDRENKLRIKAARKDMFRKKGKK